MISKRITLIALLAMLAPLAVLNGGASAQEADPACADDSSYPDGVHPGGDWRRLAQDPQSTRFQPAEDQIGPDNVTSLEVKWSFSVSSAPGGTGNFQSTTTVADGCAYAGTSNGWVFALNADTGEIVWQEQTGGGPPGGHFALPVVDGRVFGAVSAPGALRHFALDAKTGEEEYISLDLNSLDPREGSVINSSPVIFDGLAFVTLAGGRPGQNKRVPYFLFDTTAAPTAVDPETGEPRMEPIHTGYAIPEKDLEHGYSGGGIWSTAAVDPAKGYLYVGTSDSETYGQQHRNHSAVLKIDVARHRDGDGNRIADGGHPTNPEFGEIVDSYKGLVDQGYTAGTDKQPLCEENGDLGAELYFGGESSITCAELDVDFGSSPAFYTDEEGDDVVVIMQKACLLHGVFADFMQEKWRATLSNPDAFGCAAPGAVDTDRNMIFNSADPGNIWGMTDTSWKRWVSPSGSGARYQPMSTANGVTYTVDNAGNLLGYDSETGVPLLVRNMGADVGDVCTTLSGGVSIARNMVIATCDIGVDGGGWIVAYGLPGE